jgi:hypothetical protein
LLTGSVTGQRGADSIGVTLFKGDFATRDELLKQAHLANLALL